ncbi:MAG: hypothetical protein WD042_02965 [Phycisphaeraceae bacterium]
MSCHHHLSCRRLWVSACLLGCLCALSGCGTPTAKDLGDWKTIPRFVPDVDYEIVNDIKIDPHPAPLPRLVLVTEADEENRRWSNLPPYEEVRRGTRLRYLRLIPVTFMGGSAEEVAMMITSGPYSGKEVTVTDLVDCEPGPSRNTTHHIPRPKYLRIAKEGP